VRFEHTVEVAASRTAVTVFLHDVHAVAACVPGLEDVREVEPELFEGRVRVRIGPLGLNIAGRGRVKHPEGEGAWRVEGEGRDHRAASGVKATIEAHLRELGGPHRGRIAEILFRVAWVNWPAAHPPQGRRDPGVRREPVAGA
jgi:carbon-monoxide dehydrogenase small subunit